MPKKPEYLSLHQAWKLRLVPWALGRVQFTRLIHDGKIKSVRTGSLRGPRYMTKVEWVREYVRRNEG